MKDYLTPSLVGLIICVIFFLFGDCVGGHRENYSGFILDKEYHPAYTTTDSNTDEHGHTIVTKYYHPEEYHLICGEIGGQNTFDCETTRVNYYTYTNRQEVTVYSLVGRWTGCHYFSSVGPKQKAEKGW